MKRIIILGLICLFLLSGCSAETVDTLSPILQFTNVEEDGDYQKYIDMLSNGKLNAEGFYPIENSGYQEAPDGKVQVTFGKNRSLNISYSTDEKGETPIAVSSCWLSPGESIYAALRDTPNSNALYSLSEFRIQEYDADGKLLQEETRSVENGSEPILTIPETCPEGRSFWVASPVTTTLEPNPILVRNIFI